MNHNLMPVAYAAAADPFAKSPLNPVNMSRTATKRTTGHAPSTRILERVRETADDLVVLAASQHGWKFVTEKNRAMLYEMTGRALPPNVSTTKTFGATGGNVNDYYVVRAVTTVHTNIPAVLDALATRTTDAFVPAMKSIFHKHFARGVVVDKLSCTTPPPFALIDSSNRRQSFSDDDAYSVAWLALHGPSASGLSASADKHQDFTLVNYQDGYERTATNQQTPPLRIGRGALVDRALLYSANSQSQSQSSSSPSRLVGVHVLSSVNFTDVPSLPTSQHTDRQHLRTSGFVIEATNDPHAFRLSLFLSLLPTKSTLKHARRYHKWLQALASSVGNVATMIQSSTTAGVPLTLGQLGKRAWKQSDHCFICLKMFRTFRRCHHCRLCGEAVCSTCSSIVTVGSSGSFTRSNSFSSVDTHSLVATSPTSLSRSGDSSNNSNGKAFTTETRSCSVCLQHASQVTIQQQRSLSRSSSSFSTSVAESSVVGGERERENNDSLLETTGTTGTTINSIDPRVVDQYDDTMPIDYSDDTNYALQGVQQATKQHHHVATGAPSMSTTSSSFSRPSSTTTHDHTVDTTTHVDYPNPNYPNYQTQNYQNPRGFAPSFSSEVSDGSGDLSMNPDILALAGLTLKAPVPSTVYVNNNAQQQLVRSVAEEDERYSVGDDDDGSNYSSSNNNRFGWSAEQQQQQQQQQREDVDDGERFVTQPMLPRSDSSDSNSNSNSNSNNNATFHFSVRSTTATAATSTSSVHAEIAALMLQDLAQQHPTPTPNQNQIASSGPFGKPPTFAQAPQPHPYYQLQPQQPLQQQSQQYHADRRFGHRTSSQNGSFVHVDAPPSNSNSSSSFDNAAMHAPQAAAPRAWNPSASGSSSSASSSIRSSRTGSTAGSNSNFGNGYTSSKLVSAASLAARHRVHQNQNQNSTPMHSTYAPAPAQRPTAMSNATPTSDMILLAAPAPAAPEFVVFDSAERESIFMRPGDGSDMIPLDLLGGKF